MREKILYFFILIFLLVFLINPTGETERVSAGGKIWKVLEFDSGQCFTYELKRGTEELETIGEVTFWVSDSQDEMIRLTVEGAFKGETFTASAPGKAGNIGNIYINFMGTIFAELPYEVNEVLSYTIWQAWPEIPLYEEELSSDRDGYITDEYGGTYLFKILDNKGKYAGLEGYLIQMEPEEEDVNIEMCVNPELPLPLMAVKNSEEDMGVFAAELTDYKTDSNIPEWEKNRAAAESELLKVVEYFRANNLQIGERQLKSYKMIGAAAGFGLEVEGAEIELYIFDPETAEEDTLAGLNEARKTGNFFSPSFNRDIPVALNGDIMLTGLEYGDIFHPAKERIIEVFKGFQAD